MTYSVFSRCFACFAPLTAERVIRRQLAEAQIKHLEHAAIAEEHAAQAVMLAGRVLRLHALLPEPLDLNLERTRQAGAPVDADFSEVSRHG